ncbi:MAG TPA: hypothetical protein VGN69_03990 [Solirubrobacteraceae bacterium]|nr:hypothetical protein [Solirubrobacteraceae bacterium]
MAIHLRPTADLAERALLPGDPGRALALAQALLAEPRMFNHHRGLWGYTGMADDGQPLTIQSTGMGGPSAAIVLQELSDLGLRRAIRVGSCAALIPGLSLGELVVAADVLAADGTSVALGAGEIVTSDAKLTRALLAASPQARSGRAISTDLFYERDDGRAKDWIARGAVVVEMEAATLLTLGAALGLRVGCVLAVSDLLHAGRERIADEPLAEAGLRMGEAALRALA